MFGIFYVKNDRNYQMNGTDGAAKQVSQLVMNVLSTVTGALSARWG